MEYSDFVNSKFLKFVFCIVYIIYIAVSFYLISFVARFIEPSVFKGIYWFVSTVAVIVTLLYIGDE